MTHIGGFYGVSNRGYVPNTPLNTRFPYGNSKTAPISIKIWLQVTSCRSRRRVAETWQVSHSSFFLLSPEKPIPSTIHSYPSIRSRNRFSVELPRFLHERQNFSQFESFYVPFAHLGCTEGGVTKILSILVYGCIFRL